MCGRYTLRRVQLAAAAFRALLQQEFEEFSEIHRPGLYSMAPSESLPIVRVNARGERMIGLAEWGLIPSWTKSRPSKPPINAKSETISMKPMFRSAFGRRRCLIPTDGFYEPKGPKPRRGEPPRPQYFFRKPDDSLFALGGVWERWLPDTGGTTVDTFTVITTAPNEFMVPIHDRMPLVVDESDFDRWLDRTVDAQGVADILKPYDGQLETWQVSLRINNPENEGAELIEPI